MFITDTKKLTDFETKNRLWQGIPSIEVTPKGRIFLTFYSGGTTEQIGNFAVLLQSDDGVNFGEPIAAAFEEGQRCFDPCLWMDPLGRLWFTWACSPQKGVYAVVCDNPDANTLVWHEERLIGKEVMMNKPTVLSSKEWLFPITVWKKGIYAGGSTSKARDKKAFAYQTPDNGKTFLKLGGVDAPQRSYDEHMILELEDGRLAMYIRTHYGIAVSYSSNRGKTWSQATDSGLGGPSSRFHISRLKSGNILLVNHYRFTDRNNLYAMLSSDEGKTWPYKLLLDERSDISYPDAKQADDGYLYITYDRERGAGCHSVNEAYGHAREILTARITEQDIMAGKLTDAGSYTKAVASKLGPYAKKDNPYQEIVRFSDEELINYLSDKSSDEITDLLFRQYEINCMNLHKLDGKKLDTLIERQNDSSANRRRTLFDIIVTIRSVSDFVKASSPIAEKIESVIKQSLTEDITLTDIADRVNISMYYMCHLFKRETGCTIADYRVKARIDRAKELLVTSDKKISDIAYACGFGNASYFSKAFLEREKISPTGYRRLIRSSDMDDKSAIYYSMLSHLNFRHPVEKNIKKSSAVQDYIVSLPTDEFVFLHEAAIISFRDKLFAAWYNNGKSELQGYTPIRFSCSSDCGKTWTEPQTIADDKTAKILYCPPVFGVDNDRLYLMLNQMVSADHIHSLDLYCYNETTGEFDFLWSRPIPFKLNTNVLTMQNGKMILPGRIAELDGFPNTPAVLISDNGHMDADWRTVPFCKNGDLADGSRLVHPELTLTECKDTLYGFCRNDQRNVPLVYLSHNSGENWTGPFSHDIPFASSKIYSGSLSDGRNYLVGNIYYRKNAPRRATLAVYFSKPGTMQFDKRLILQDGYSDALKMGVLWHYPAACESNGKLYIIYTVTVDEENPSKRGAVVSVIDLNQI